MTSLAPDTLLRRAMLAAALTDAGYPIAEPTLATMATRGGGPPFKKFGRTPLYVWGSALAWAEARCTPPVRSTSELDKNPPAATFGVTLRGEAKR